MHLAHLAGEGRSDLHLHLHRRNGNQSVARVHQVALGHQHLLHHTGHGTAQLARLRRVCHGALEHKGTSAVLHIRYLLGAVDGEEQFAVSLLHGRHAFELHRNCHGCRGVSRRLSCLTHVSSEPHRHRHHEGLAWLHAVEVNRRRQVSQQLPALVLLALHVVCEHLGVQDGAHAFLGADSVAILLSQCRQVGLQVCRGESEACTHSSLLRNVSSQHGTLHLCREAQVRESKVSSEEAHY
mmetsp:Transcript_25975/g.48784  ORF Transcript_25975/g.48784 Transcript_25975/m.48784 type:complete len:239 (+) Transcript_25975:200-916(+)